MSKKCGRYFGGLLSSQARWLDKMSDRGWRLVRAERLIYEFEPCRPGQVRYCVEYIGNRSHADAEEYRCFLEDLGYRTFYKNVNLNWNIGKVVARPWADRGGRLAADATTLNRELLIVEKENDGKQFQLHTTFEDKIRYYKAMRRPGLFLLAMSVALGAVLRTWVAGIFAVLALIQIVACQIELARLEKQGKLQEW